MISRRDIMKSGAGALIASALGPVTVFAQAADFELKLGLDDAKLLRGWWREGGGTEWGPRGWSGVEKCYKH